MSEFGLFSLTVVVLLFQTLKIQDCSIGAIVNKYIDMCGASAPRNVMKSFQVKITLLPLYSMDFKIKPNGMNHCRVVRHI